MSILTFYFDSSSPFAYLGATQVEALAAKHDAQLNWHPMLLGALFRAIGTPMVPLFEMPKVKQAYQQRDIERFAALYEVPYTFPTRFPMNTVKALRMVLQIDNAERGRFVVPLCRAYWADDRDINDDAVLTDVATLAGFDGAALLAGCSDPDIKLSLRKHTEQAEKQGVCGAPSYLVQHDDSDEGMLFWGQDRMPLIDKALAGWRPTCG